MKFLKCFCMIFAAPKMAFAQTVFLSMLGSNAVCKKLSSAWTPKWANVISYQEMDGTLGAISNGSIITNTVGSNATAYNNNTNMSHIVGMIGSAISVDGTDDYLRFLDEDSFSPSTTSNSFAINIWVNIGDNSTTGGDGSNYRKYIVAKGTTSNFEYSLYRTASTTTRIEFCLFTLDGSSSNCFTVLDPYVINTWYMITIVGDGTNLTSYINGRATGSKTITISNGNGTANLTLGMRTNGFLNGKFDDFAYWSTNLSAPEVLSIYESQKCNR